MGSNRRVGSAFDRLLDLLALFAGSLILFLVLAISVDVVMRYFVRSPMLWVDAVSEAILVYAPFLAAAWLLREDGHVMVELLYDKVSLPLQTVMRIGTSILGAGVCLILAWFSGQATWKSFQQGVKLIGGITYPKYILLAPIPVGFLLLFIQFVRRSYANWTYRPSNGRPQRH